MTFHGETDWIGYRLTFLNPNDVNVPCLMTMNSFTLPEQ